MDAGRRASARAAQNAAVFVENHFYNTMGHPKVTISLSVGDSLGITGPKIPIFYNCGSSREAKAGSGCGDASARHGDLFGDDHLRRNMLFSRISLGTHLSLRPSFTALAQLHATRPRDTTRVKVQP